MANEVVLKFKISEDGSLKVISKDADKAASSLDKTTKSSEKANNSQEKLNKSKKDYQKREKGVAGITSNSTKAFAKQAQGIDGWLVPAYATLAANVFAVTAAFGVLQRAKAVEQLNQGLVFTGRAAGQNLGLLVDKLAEVTQGAVSAEARMKSVAVAVSAGFSESQIVGLTEVAKGASLALGRDMTDAMDRLVRGAAKLEPEILDELGIMIRLDDVATKFGATLGKNASELTNFEKRMAFTNAIIDQGTIKYGALSKVIEANPYDKLAASFNDLTKQVLNGATALIEPFVTLLADYSLALVGAAGVFVTGLVKQLAPGIRETVENQKKIAIEATRQAQQASKVVSSEYTKALKKVNESFKTVPKSVEKMKKAFQSGTQTVKQTKAAVLQLKKSEELRTTALKRYSGDVLAAKRAEYNEVKALRIEMERLLVAEAKRGTLSSAGQAAQDKKKTASVTARGLSTMENQGMLDQFKTAYKYSLLNFRTVAKTNGVVNVMKASYRAIAGSVRLMGTALLNAIPVIGQMLFFGTMLYDMFKDFFDLGSKPSSLDKALDKAEERYKEFPKIAEQFRIAFEASEGAVARFVSTLTPASGIMQQITDQAAEFINVQRADMIREEVEANMELEASLLAVEKASKAQSESLGTNNHQGAGENDGIWQSMASLTAVGTTDKMAQDNVKAAQSVYVLKQETEDYTKAKKRLDAAQAATIDPLKTTEGIQRAIYEGIATFNYMRIVAEGSGGATKLLDDNIKNLNGILSKLRDGDLTPTQALAALRAVNTEFQGINQSSKAASDTVAKLNAIFAKSQRTTGTYATHIDALQETFNALKPGVEFSEIMEQYSEGLKKFGITSEKELTETLKLLKEVNQAALERSKVDAERATQQQKLAMSGQTLFAAETALTNATSRRLELETALDAARATKDPTIILAAELAYQTSITTELQKQVALVQKKASNATRLGGEGAGNAVLASDNFNLGKDNLSKDAGVSDKIKLMSDSAKPLIADLAKLGPDGELMASITSGALNFSEAFMTAFEETGSAADKTMAALQAVGAGIQAIGAIQAAKSKVAIANIDAEIAAEKKRDGQSQSSLAKISAMEQKKDAMKRKAFEQDKKAKMASVVMNTASALMGVWNVKEPYVGPGLAMAYSGLIAGLGAAQLAAISSTSYSGGAGSISGGATSISVGSRNNTVDLATSTSASGELAYARGEKGTGSGMSDYTPAFTGYRASGGNTSFMVGEQGPELFVPDRPGTIVPADETEQAVSQPVNVSFNISAIDSRGVEDMLSTQRGNIIGMIREAANAHGESFLEAVDESTYYTEN